MNSSAPYRSQQGFTLIESIMAIVILGILSGIVAVFIRGPIDAYVDSKERALLTDAADGAMRRIGRDLQTALPNSFRSASSSSTACIEYLPVVGGGRYRNQTSSGGHDKLNFATADTSFDVLGHVGLDALPAGTNLVTIYNLGVPGADAYAGDNTGTIQSASGTTISLNPGKKFPFESPGKRFQVIPNLSVVYFCSGTGLYRKTQAIASSKMASCPSSSASDALLVSNVTCSFTYEPAVTTRNGVVAISLVLTRNNESVRLYNEVSVSNAP
jgi:MSHA biogenesis protein MshO